MPDVIGVKFSKRAVISIYRLDCQASIYDRVAPNDLSVIFLLKLQHFVRMTAMGKQASGM